MDAWYLRHTESGHNKHYFVWLVPTTMTTFEVWTGWGKIGASPQMQVETSARGSFNARSVAEELVRRKLSRGYRLVWVSGPPGYSTWDEFCKFARASKGETNYVNTPVPAAWTSTLTPAAPKRRKPKATLPEPVPEKEPGPPPKKSKAKEEKVIIKRHDADWNF